MNLPSKHPRDYTVADLEKELRSRGACIRWLRASQNLNHKHFPGQENWWFVRIGPDYPSLDWNGREGYGSAPTLEIAIAKAFRSWDQWTEPDFGERIRREAEARRNVAKPTKLKFESGTALLLALGMKPKDPSA